MPYNGFRILDFHAHFPTNSGERLNASLEDEYLDRFDSEKLKHLSALGYAAEKKRWAAWNMQPPFKERLEDTEIMKLWDEDRKNKNIDEIVFVTGGGNENLSALVSAYENFSGFAHHSPEEKDAPLKLEKAIKEYGLKGYKILAPTVGIPLNDRRFFFLWQKAEELRIPILIHFGILGGGAGYAGKPNCNPLILEDVAKGFPYLNFVIPHFGAGYMRELLLLGWSCPNIYTDTSGSNQWIKWLPCEMDKKSVLRRFIETFGTRRIVFGTDSSFLPRGFIIDYLKEWMIIANDLNLRDDDVADIFYNNGHRLIYGGDEA